MLHLQLPSHIHHFFKTYCVLSQTRNALQCDHNVSAYMRKTSDAQLDVLLRHFMNRSKVVHQHLPPHTPRIVQSMLRNWTALSPLENLPTLDVFKPIADTALLSPERSLYARKFSKFESTVLGRLKALSNPQMMLPRTKIATKQFLWYTKLLKETPVIIFLAKRERLFSDESLHQIDIGRTELQTGIHQLSGAMKIRLGSHRTYHLADLTSTDIFKLAMDKQEMFENAEPTQFSLIITKSHGVHIRREDALCQQLGNDRITFHQKNGGEISEAQIQDILLKTSLKEALKDIRQDPDCFSYDMHYTSYHMITIEKDILTESHDELVELIESSPFDVIGARLSLKYDALADFIKQEQFSSNAKPRHTYDELIAQAIEKHPEMAPKKHINDLFKLLAGLGLVKVVPEKDTLYLLRGPSSDSQA